MNQHVSYAYGIADWGLPTVVRGEGNHILACPRYPVRKLMTFDDDGNVIPGPRNLLPLKYLEVLQHNQLLSSCCRHPENHDIEAWYSCQDMADKGEVDIYILHCTCGRKHRRFCMGGTFDPVTGEKTHPRPFWEVR